MCPAAATISGLRHLPHPRASCRCGPRHGEAFGFEVCTPPTERAGFPFATFIALLEKNQRVDAWRFAPDRIRIHHTTTFALPNRGRIPHSFTEVAEFGGGFVELLNVLSGNPDPAPSAFTR